MLNKWQLLLLVVVIVTASEVVEEDNYTQRSWEWNLKEHGVKLLDGFSNLSIHQKYLEALVKQIFGKKIS